MVYLYTLTIFTSALLLFLIQPMFARMVLPSLGGSPAVWNTVLVFFQAALLAGYAYAHFTTRWLGAKRQAVLHAILVLLPLLVLPITLPPSWRPPTEGSPVGSLMELLLTRVGLPFFVIAATSPLLQRWFSRSGHKAANDPYFLYAASNCGSMLALLGYPFLLEPHLSLGNQSTLWMVGYYVCAVLLLACTAAMWRFAPATQNDTEDAAPAPPLSRQRVLRWVLLAFVPSSLMMSVTQTLTTDIVAMPLLWILPLTLYLLTFILVFAKHPPFPHGVIVRAVPMIILPLIILVSTRVTQPILLLFPLHLICFFLLAMMCHGELAADRPAPRYLTTFYLWISVGGVLGGAFNALLAPLLFNSLLEYPLVLALGCALLPFGREKTAELPNTRTRLLDFVLPAAITLLLIGMMKFFSGWQELGAFSQVILFGIPTLLCFPFSRRPLRFALAIGGIFLAGSYFLNGDKLLLAARSFFGVHRVMATRNNRFHAMVHGGINHGLQSLDPKWSRRPLSYYFTGGPPNQALDSLEQRMQRKQTKVGVVGLGAGVLAAYALPGEEWTFYEIDPVVEKIARDPRYFTYLRDCRANWNIELGDGRLSLQNAKPHYYDLLILDAYSSDSLPVHMMTKEAVQLYMSRLKPGGLLLFHISNLYLDLEPALGNVAQALKLTALIEADFPTREQSRQGKNPSVWLIMARQPQDLAVLQSTKKWRSVKPQPDIPVWTDDFSSVTNVLKWHRILAAR